MIPGDTEEEAAPPSELLRDLDRLTGSRCEACARELCGHDVLLSVFLGVKNAPRCLSCLAKGLRQAGPDLRDEFVSFIQHRDCYRQAWQVASEREKQAAQTRDSCCPWTGLTLASAPPPTVAKAPEPEEQTKGQLVAAWDAGTMGCGDLVLELRSRLTSLPPGAVLEVTACDPGAPEDLPAWCRLTGHRLLSSTHPRYLLQRKGP